VACLPLPADRLGYAAVPTTRRGSLSDTPRMIMTAALVCDCCKELTQLLEVELCFGLLELQLRVFR
jgi:hypothetical protein